MQHTYDDDDFDIGVLPDSLIRNVKDNRPQFLFSDLTLCFEAIKQEKQEKLRERILHCPSMLFPLLLQCARFVENQEAYILLHAELPRVIQHIGQYTNESLYEEMGRWWMIEKGVNKRNSRAVLIAQLLPEWQPEEADLTFLQTWNDEAINRVVESYCMRSRPPL